MMEYSEKRIKIEGAGSSGSFGAIHCHFTSNIRFTS